MISTAAISIAFAWIGNAVLLLVILPIVVYLLRGVLVAARSIPPTVAEIVTVVDAATADLNAIPLLVTTEAQVKNTVAGVARYGGSLDVILDDA
ncbi:MAG: hypothetical protein ACR2IP_13270 [Solirubrobacteraceae bacterium]